MKVSVTKRWVMGGHYWLVKVDLERGITTGDTRVYRFRTEEEARKFAAGIEEKP